MIRTAASSSSPLIMPTLGKSESHDNILATNGRTGIAQVSQWTVDPARAIQKRCKGAGGNKMCGQGLQSRQHPVPQAGGLSDVHPYDPPCVRTLICERTQFIGVRCIGAAESEKKLLRKSSLVYVRTCTCIFTGLEESTCTGHHGASCLPQLTSIPRYPQSLKCETSSQRMVLRPCQQNVFRCFCCLVSRQARPISASVLNRHPRPLRSRKIW